MVGWKERRFKVLFWFEKGKSKKQESMDETVFYDHFCEPDVGDRVFWLGMRRSQVEDWEGNVVVRLQQVVTCVHETFNRFFCCLLNNQGNANVSSMLLVIFQTVSLLGGTFIIFEQEFCEWTNCVPLTSHVCTWSRPSFRGEPLAYWHTFSCRNINVVRRGNQVVWRLCKWEGKSQVSIEQRLISLKYFRLIFIK